MCFVVCVCCLFVSRDFLGLLFVVVLVCVYCLLKSSVLCVCVLLRVFCVFLFIFRLDMFYPFRPLRKKIPNYDRAKIGGATGV